MKLAQIFRDGLILQRNKPIRVFGEGMGNVTVRLELESGGDVQYRTAKADDKGSWLVTLDARPAGGPYIMTVTCGLESITLRSIMIGTLLLFTGQSNNAMSMAEEVTPESEYVRDALLRIYFCDRILKNEGSNINAGWLSAFPERIGSWAALAYLLGLEYRRAEPDTAVGLVICSQGASCIQSWMDEKLFCGDDEALAYHHNPVERYKLFNGPGMLYHHMLEPLMPMSFGYALWYQGECNTYPNEAQNYRRMLEMLVSCHRKGFMDDELFFCIVQIADNISPKYPELWKLVQDTQAEAPSFIQHCTTVKCADICENDVIHPPTKWKLAKRIFETMNKRC